MNESYIILGEIEISPLIRAADKFQQFLANAHSEQEKSGAIQAFEYTYELSWKMMKRVLKHQGIDANSPRETFREAAVNKIISDPLIWFKFMKQRNLTVHTYNTKCVDEIMGSLPEFEKEVMLLIQTLQLMKV